MLYNDIDINNTNILSIKEELLSSPDFLCYYLNNYKGEIKQALLFKKSAYTEYNIKLFYDKLNNEGIDYIFDLKFKDSPYSLNKCLLSNNFKYDYYYNENTFTEENKKVFINKYFDNDDPYVPSIMLSNKEFLVEVINHNKFEMLEVFSEKLFDNTIINLIIDKINSKVEISTSSTIINNSDKVLNALLNNNNLDSYFEFNKPARTKENTSLFISKLQNSYQFKNSIINYFSDDITENSDILKGFIKSRNIGLINKFSDKAYTDDNKKSFIDLYKEVKGNKLIIPECLYSSNDLLSFIFKNNIFDYYLFNEEAYTKENIELLNEKIKETGGIFLREGFKAVQNSKETLKNLFLYNEFFKAWQSSFSLEAYTDENIDLFFESYLNGNKIPECLFGSNYLLKKLLNNNFITDAVRFDLSVYKEEDKNNLIEKIKSKVFIDFRDASESILTDEKIFYESLKNVDTYNISCFQSINMTSNIAKEYFKKLNSNISITLSDEMLKDLINNNLNMVLAYIKQNDDNKAVVLDLLLDNPNNNIYNKEFYDIVKDYIVFEFNDYKKEHIEKFIETFGYKAIIYIWGENKNVLDILNFNDEKFNKFINLFNKNLTKDNIINIYDSITQQKFAMENHDNIEIFHNILKCINENEDPKHLLLKLVNYVDIVYKDDSDIYKFEYLQKLVNTIKIGSIEEKQKMTNILHTITDYYIKCLREDYRNIHLNDYKNSLKETVTGIDLDKLKIKYLIISDREKVIEYLKNNSGSDRVIEELLQNIPLLNSCLDYICDSSINNFDSVDINLVRRSIKNLNNTLFNLPFDTNNINNDIWNELYSKSKKTYIVDKDNSEIFRILNNINLYNFDHILRDDNKYNTFKEIMDKYKFIFWDQNIYNEFKNIGQDLSSLNISSFIDNFDKVYNKNDIKNPKLLELVKYIRLYSKDSSKYKMLFLDEDYELLKNNPSPNAAFGVVEQKRLNLGVESCIQSFKRNKLKVPPIKKTIAVENKIVEVILGDFKDPNVLTLGERTKSCMRIGGTGEELYNFCLYNDAGFHIIFKNPYNNSFISRVSGFRNGNTVFLNELRNSEDDSYSDDDLIKALEKVSQDLINITKDTSSPIENIVVSKEYAMKKSKKEEVQFNITSCKNDMGEKFYSDINNYGVVLATVSDKDFVPMITGNKNILSYKTLRNEPIYTENNSLAQEKINRILIVSQLINGKEFLDCDTDNFNNGIINAYIGDDWYIYTDKENKIHKCLIKTDNRAEDEYNNYLELLNNKIKSR